MWQQASASAVRLGINSIFGRAEVKFVLNACADTTATFSPISGLYNCVYEKEVTSPDYLECSIGREKPRCDIYGISLC